LPVSVVEAIDADVPTVKIFCRESAVKCVQYREVFVVWWRMP